MSCFGDSQSPLAAQQRPQSLLACPIDSSRQAALQPSIASITQTHPTKSDCPSPATRYDSRTHTHMSQHAVKTSLAQRSGPSGQPPPTHPPQNPSQSVPAQIQKPPDIRPLNTPASGAHACPQPAAVCVCGFGRASRRAGGMQPPQTAAKCGLYHHQHLDTGVASCTLGPGG